MIVSIPHGLEKQVRDQIASGLYTNEAEVVRGALEQFFAQDELTSWIRDQASLGFTQLDNCNYEDLTRDEWMARLTKSSAA